MSDADARGSILSAEALKAIQHRHDHEMTVDQAQHCKCGRLSPCDSAALLVHVEAQQRHFEELQSEINESDFQVRGLMARAAQLETRLAQADAARQKAEGRADAWTDIERRSDDAHAYGQRYLMPKAWGENVWHAVLDDAVELRSTVAAQAERITHLVNLEHQRLRVDEDTADALTCFLKWDQTPELTLDADTISALHDLKASFKKYRAALVASRSPAQEKP